MNMNILYVTNDDVMTTAIINICRLYFGTKPRSELLLKRREKFLVAYNSLDSFLCNMYTLNTVD